MSQNNEKQTTFLEPEEWKTLILNSPEPFVIKKYLNWDLIKWDLEDWRDLLKNEKLTFRCGLNSFTKEPQWERKTFTKEGTFEDFLLFTQVPNDKWMYFDYKYLKEWFHNIQELKNNIDWSSFGFPDLSSEDSTMWIGSKGAHTPCHVDTYGCNLVAQIYGRKQWILSPPDEDLKPTRIPYEESSIYSKLNFFSPDVDDFKGVKNCRKVVLEPGDVLIVPHKWWHYVENLDTAISVNVWLPLPIDDEERLKESVVQMFIAQITKDLPKDMKEHVLNPNSDEEVNNINLNDSLHLISACRSVLKHKKLEEPVHFKDGEAYFKKCLYLQCIPTLSEKNFYKFLQEQRKQFTSSEPETLNSDCHDLTNIINAFTHFDTVSLVVNKLLSFS